MGKLDMKVAWAEFTAVLFKIPHAETHPHSETHPLGRLPPSHMDVFVLRRSVE